MPSRWRRLKVVCILFELSASYLAVHLILGSGQYRNAVPTQVPGTKQSTKKAACWPLRLRRLRRSLDDYHSFFLVKLLKHHFDDLALLCRNEFTDVISLN